MHVLSVAPYVPFDGIDHAGGSYLLEHLRALTRAGHDVTLVVPGTTEQQDHALLAPAWLHVVVGPDALGGRTFSRRLLDAAYRRAMTCPPNPGAESLRSVRRAGLVERACAADIVELHWAEYAHLAGTLSRAGVRTPIVVVEHDVDLDIGFRRVLTTTRGYRRALGLLTAPLIRAGERRGLAAADLVLVFKAADEGVLRRAGVATAAQVIDPWLDEPAADGTPRDPHAVVFVGALWRQENADGVLHFLRHVWPLVRHRNPNATFRVVGARPTAELASVVERTEGAELAADVPDLVPHYLGASVFVAPLYVPGGLKFKVPQAMLCGLAVVASRVAAQGVVEAAPPGALWAVTDDPCAMADAVCKALDDPARAREVGRVAADWCRSRFSFARSMDVVQARYLELVSRSG